MFGGGEASLEEGSQPDLTELSLEQLASVKVATVYGASKHEQAVSEAPSSVSIVSRDDIQKLGYRTLQEVLNGVRGFYTTYDRAYSYVGVRGFSLPGDYGGRLLICIDGHRVNDAIYGQAPNGWDLPLDVDLIERVEVIRGPGSSLYGNNAMFGVVNIITRRGGDLGGAEVSGSYGSYDTWTGRLSYGGRTTNGVEIALSGTFLDSAGHDTLVYHEFSEVNGGHAEELDDSRGGSGFLSLSYGDFSLQGGYGRRDKTLPTAAYGAVFNEAGNEISDERGFSDLKFHHEFENELEVTARLYWDHYQYAGRAPIPEFDYGDPRYPGAITSNRDHTHAESLGSEFQVSKTLFERHCLIAGVDYRHDFALEQRNYDKGGQTYLDSDSTGDTVGVYGQDEYSISDKWILNVGLRYDYFSSFGSTINPRAAVIYTPWTNSTFKAIYGQAYRAPNAYELYYEAPGYASNSELDPETSRSYELGFEQQIGPHFGLVTSLFYYQIDDLITFQEEADGSSSFANVANARSMGAELGLEARWWKGWRANLSYTYADARDTDTDEWLPNSPRNVVKGSLTVPLWLEKLFLTGELLGLSERRTVEGGEVGGYILANLTLYSRDILKNLQVSASVHNLFDTRFRDPVSSDFTQHSIEQDGRTLLVKLTYRF